MVTQSTLFDSPPAQRHSPTSIAAARSVRTITGEQRQRVLAWFTARGTEGSTDDECQQGTGINPSAQRPRRVELVRLGAIADSGRTRVTASGRAAVVWVAT